MLFGNRKKQNNSSSGSGTPATDTGDAYVKDKPGGKPEELGKAGAPGGGYKPDNAKRMPVANSPAAIHAARKKRRDIMARGGRASTRLVNSPGTASFINSFLGGTN